MSCSAPAVFDCHQAQALCRRARSRESPIACRKDRTEPLARDLRPPHPEERADDPANHPAKETVRLDDEAEKLPLPGQVRTPHRPLAALARGERAEIVTSDEPRRGVPHRLDVEAMWHDELAVPLQ